MRNLFCVEFVPGDLTLESFPDYWIEWLFDVVELKREGKHDSIKGFHPFQRLF